MKRTSDDQRAVHRAESAARRARSPAAVMWSDAKARAKKRGVEFSIDVSDVVIPTHCPILGIALQRTIDAGHRHHAPSLDRIDPQRGYVRGNVAVISHKANRLKGEGTVEEHEAIAVWMRRQTPTNTRSV